MKEKENVNNKSMINEYKILIILITLSVILSPIVLILYLKDSSSIIGLSLLFGLVMEIFVLYMMIISLRSEDKWIVFIDFNSKHEGIFELILMIAIVIIGIIAIVESL